MTDEQKNSRPEVAPDSEALYSEAFARERSRRTRRAFVFGGIAFILCGMLVVHETVIAIQTGTSVALGPLGHELGYPPFIAGPLGVLSFLIGLSILASLFLPRKRK